MQESDLLRSRLLRVWQEVLRYMISKRKKQNNSKLQHFQEQEMARLKSCREKDSILLASYLLWLEKKKRLFPSISCISSWNRKGKIFTASHNMSDMNDECILSHTKSTLD